jgi:hypothetical protein
MWSAAAAAAGGPGSRDTTVEERTARFGSNFFVQLRPHPCPIDRGWGGRGLLNRSFSTVRRGCGAVPEPGVWAGGERVNRAPNRASESASIGLELRPEPRPTTRG